MCEYFYYVFKDKGAHPSCKYMQMASTSTPSPRAEHYGALSNGLRRLLDWLTGTAEGQEMRPEGAERFLGTWRGQQVLYCQLSLNTYNKTTRR